jgi:archaellum component FlaF (FlaF/FlaG flagellin family)
MLEDDLETGSLKHADVQNAAPRSFEVTIENVSTNYDYFAAGGKFIPDGKDAAGPAFPGESFTIQFHAGKGHRLSFASMYGASNDLFYGPSGEGIALFSGDTPLTGDITGMISLWDAGTEVNHAPASGEDGAEESVPVQSLRNVDNVMDGYSYHSVEENIKVTLDYDGTSRFTLKIDVLPGSSTPLSPVAWVVHYDGQNPIFTEGSVDYGNGLEDLAETGNAGPLSTYLEMLSGYVSPVAPGVWVLHKKWQKPIFAEGELDYGEGLEMLSEVGDPTGVYNSLIDKGYETGVYNTPTGAGGPGPLFPGESYSFTFEAHAGEYLSFASMLGKSNDEFFAPGDMGIRLYNGNHAINGDITSQIKLWDAGTEINEYPGAGIHQGAGETEESKNVMVLNDDFTWPEVSQVIRVTIRSERSHGHGSDDEHWNNDHDHSNWDRHGDHHDDRHGDHHGGNHSYNH